MKFLTCMDSIGIEDLARRMINFRHQRHRSCIPYDEITQKEMIKNVEERGEKGENGNQKKGRKKMEKRRREGRRRRRNRRTKKRRRSDLWPIRPESGLFLDPGAATQPSMARPPLLSLGPTSLFSYFFHSQLFLYATIPRASTLFCHPVAGPPAPSFPPKAFLRLHSPPMLEHSHFSSTTRHIF